MSDRPHTAIIVCALACALALGACGSRPVQESQPEPTSEQETITTTQVEGARREQEEGTQDTAATEGEDTMQRITITVNGQDFEAELADSDCGRAFADLLPAELEMSELNGNEKYCYTGTALPADAVCPGRIEAGDLMLYGSDCVVLFYESFDTGYSYTRIGRLTDPQGIAEAAGTGSANVTFAAGD